MGFIFCLYTKGKLGLFEKIYMWVQVQNYDTRRAVSESPNYRNCPRF